MPSKTRFTIVSALLGCVLFVASDAYAETAKTPWPMVVGTTPEAETCIKTLLEEKASENTVSASVGESFIECMRDARASNFYEFDRYKSVGTILMNKPFPCFKKASEAGAICVVVPVETTPVSKGRIVIIAASDHSKTLSLTIDTSEQSSELRMDADGASGTGEPVKACKNSYGDACGTKY